MRSIVADVSSHSRIRSNAQRRQTGALGPCSANVIPLNSAPVMSAPIVDDGPPRAPAVQYSTGAGAATVAEPPPHSVPAIPFYAPGSVCPTSGPQRRPARPGQCAELDQLV